MDLPMQYPSGVGHVVAAALKWGMLQLSISRHFQLIAAMYIVVFDTGLEKVPINQVYVYGLFFA
jgi:hypothetical protein